MAEPPPANFNFEYFESIANADKIVAVKYYLERKFPEGSAPGPVVQELKSAGAKCELVHDHGTFYFCTYNYYKGLFPFPFEWHVGIYINENTGMLTKFEVGRGVTGP